MRERFITRHVGVAMSPALQCTLGLKDVRESYSIGSEIELLVESCAGFAERSVGGSWSSERVRSNFEPEGSPLI